jgi:hypothetical protein
MDTIFNIMSSYACDFHEMEWQKDNLESSNLSSIFKSWINEDGLETNIIIMFSSRNHIPTTSILLPYGFESS